MDMLVKLYALPDYLPDRRIRKALPHEADFVCQWVGRYFSKGWACEALAAIHKGTCHILLENHAILGFCCYDITALGFFGPEGVDPACQGKGLGKALLLDGLHAMRVRGYGYAIIGAVGPVDFYKKSVGATVIEDSTPGVYGEELR